MNLFRLRQRVHPLVAPLLLFLFWWGSLAHLARFPALHNDEVSILAAGYKLFHQGVYGVDMYAGWHGRETIYLEIMPLMPWLQGLGSWLWGLGVWQMRLLPVMCGLLTLALAFALGRLLANWLVGILAMLLLLAWQWSPGGAAFFGSGVALVDLVRIGRYDVLTAPLSLGIMLTWLAARRTNQPRLYLLCGLLIGLAGLAQLYGLFWLAVVAVWWLGEWCLKEWRLKERHSGSTQELVTHKVRLGDWEIRRLIISQSLISQSQKGKLFLERHRVAVSWRHMGLLFWGSLSIMAVWLALVLTHWPEFLAQFGMHQARFDLLNPLFYVNNIKTEGQRYFLGIQQSGTFWRWGFWLVVVGLPLALGWLGWRVARWHDQHAFWLLVPCLLLPLLFALLVQKKQFAYLLLVLPLWSVALAWGLASLGQSGQWPRQIAIVLGGLMAVEGGMAWAQLHMTAVHSSPPAPFFAELAEMTPDGRLLGPQTYWLAFPERDYRSFVVPLVLAQPENDQAVSLDVALTAVDPDVVLVNPTILEWLAASGQEEQFWHFMADHQAQLTGALPAYEGGVVQIYQLR